MSSDSGKILVLGGTGRQGGAVARELLGRGRPVRVLVRDPMASTARRLADSGAEVVRGDLDEPRSLEAAMRGVHGVFSVQTFMTDGGVAAEERQGRSVAEAAVRAGVAHLVYSSVGGAERSSGVPHFESKGRIERYVDELGLPATVLRPTMFIDNFHQMGPRAVDGELVLALWLPPDTPLQMIATDDIGAFAADAFEDPPRYLGRRIEIAGDELTGPQMAEVFGRAARMPARFQELPLDQLRAMDAETALMFEWFVREGYQADLPALRRLRPGLATLESWLDRSGWTVQAG